MAGLLSGGLSGVFAAAFAPLYLPGLVHRYDAPQFDDGGSVIPGSEPDLIDCRVQVDACTEAMRGEADYTDKDVRLLILAQGVGVLTTNDRVEVLSGACTGVYLVQSVGVDPAGSVFDCRGRPDG